MPNRRQSNLLRKVRCIADYQFGRGIGEKLFPNDVMLVLSKGTGRIRYVYLDGELLATLRPKDGYFSLTIKGAKRIFDAGLHKQMMVRVQDEVSPFIEKGRNVFAKHVVEAAQNIRPGEEVIVLNQKNELLAVGKALLSGREMKAFKKGVAVLVRRGRSRET